MIFLSSQVFKIVLDFECHKSSLPLHTLHADQTAQMVCILSSAVCPILHTGTFLEKIRAKSQKYRRYTGNFPQMPVYTGASVFIRATWAHCFRSEIMLFSTNVCVYGRARIYKGYWFM